ncbi:chemotaxis protein CheA [Psychromonas sp. PT13]|uniref:chemotaxis protein CheA n=1 Tax=Psychromonas sp. PT13 TaxID=3439547 RepID=UPI003EBFCCFD
MTFEVDDEILQDFLVEAGEILELLSEQLVDLENNPNDTELLNAIFRGFHTVKGGAGFLSLTELVETCHGAENVFDCLRQNNRSVNAGLMDTILGALDVINTQFEAVQSGDEVEAAPPEVLEQLHRLSKPESEDEVQPEPIVEEVVVEEEPASSGDSSIDEMTQNEFDALLDELHSESGSTVAASAASVENAEISEDEFESLLDELHGASGPSKITPNESVASSDEMNDDEFESLLDELHGKGAHTGQPTPVTAESKPAASGDEITDDEFESLLDELHGVGKSVQTIVDEPPKASKPVIKEVQSEPVVKKPEPIPAVKKEKPVTPAAAPQTAKKAPVAKAEPTVRVDTAILDELMNMVGELVLVRNRLVSLETNSEDEEISRAVANLDIVTGDLQGSVMKTRMQPIKKVFGKFPRVVRDLARTLGKDIRLDLVGEETDLDKNLVEALADPLVHLVRNSVDHGIEMPNIRMQNGKEKQGCILLSASQEGDHILLVIEDDGAGMDAQKLKGIAMSKGILDQDGADRMSDKEAYSLIFAPGFSTKVEISDISGRGVGMDVVKTGISKLNGTISIDSELGKGTRLEITVPLTLAILPTLMIVVEEQTFALPLTNVNEIFHLDLSKTNYVDGQLTIVIREHAIPLFYLRDWLAKDAAPVEKRKGVGHIVIVQLGVKQVAFVVDALLGQEEVVIKPLDKLLTGTPGMAGATITSDGGIALILDLPSLLKHYV